MHSALSRCILITIVFAFSGCSTVPPIGSVNDHDIDAMRKVLSTRAGEYQTGSKAWGNKELWNNGPLILFGAGSVAAASFASGAAKANWLVGLALVAGVWALTYSTLDPETKQDAYSSAAGQFSCLELATANVDEALYPGLTAQRKKLTAQLNVLSDQLNSAGDIRASLPADLANSDEVQVLKADALIAKANAALMPANAELSAQTALLPSLKNLIYTIDRKTQLAARGKLLTPGDISTALTSEVGAATSSSVAKGGAAVETGQNTISASAPVAAQPRPVQDYVNIANAVDRLRTALINNPILVNKTYSSTAAAIKQCVAS